MGKYKVLKEFTDTQAKCVRKIGDEIELTEERHAELEKNLQEFGGGYLELIVRVVEDSESAVEKTPEPVKKELLKKETPKKTSKSK